MTVRTIHGLLLSLLLVASCGLRASHGQARSETTLPLLQLSPYAYTTSLGGAAVALPEGPPLLRTNPGRLGLVRAPAAGLGVQTWIDDTRQQVIEAALPIGRVGVGLDLAHFDAGTVVEVGDDFERTGARWRNQTWMLGLGAGTHRRLGPGRLGVGTTLRVAEERLVGDARRVWMADLGVLYTDAYLSLGVAWTHQALAQAVFGEETDPLPTRLTVGAAYQRPWGLQGRWRVTGEAALDPAGQPRALRVGAEVALSALRVRSGAHLRPQDRSTWSTGIGLHLPLRQPRRLTLILDYAFTPQETWWGATHRVGVAVRSQPSRRRLRQGMAGRARPPQPPPVVVPTPPPPADPPPPAPAPPPPAPPRTAEPLDVAFETGSAILTEASYPALAALAEELRADPARRLWLAGHTDNTGPDALNMQLAQDRVASVVRRLVETEGLDPDRLVSPLSYGMRRPIASNDTPEGRALNRRVEGLVLEAADSTFVPDASAVTALQLDDPTTLVIELNGTASYTEVGSNQGRTLTLTLPGLYSFAEPPTLTTAEGPIARAEIQLDGPDARVVVTLREARPVQTVLDGTTLRVRVE
ncbi:MAG: OmpA family protein [Bacteroidota bacterium]